MQKASEGVQRTVPEIFEGVVVPEAGHFSDRGPEAAVLLRHQISRTIDRLVMVGHEPGICSAALPAGR